MIRATWTQRIARPAEQVFDYVADLDHESDWNPDAANAVRTSAGAIGLGAVWEQDFRRAGHVVSMIDGYERPHRLSFHAESPQSEARVVFEFAAVDAATTDVSCRVEIALKGSQRLLEPLLRRRLRRRMERARGPGLKRALERT